MIVKRSLSIRGHRTSISLEEPFWSQLRLVAEARGLSLPALVALIDRERAPDHNLSSAIRVFVLGEVIGRTASSGSEDGASQKFAAPA